MVRQAPEQQESSGAGAAQGGPGHRGGVGQAGPRGHVNPASLQPGPQRLAGLVHLADTVYEDLQSCYGVYASLFHR